MANSAHAEPRLACPRLGTQASALHAQRMLSDRCPSFSYEACKMDGYGDEGQGEGAELPTQLPSIAESLRWRSS